MPDFNQELANAPIAQLLGSFGNTLVETQYAASLHSFELFKSIAFDDNGDMNMVQIKYNRVNPDFVSTDPASPPTIAQKIEVPVVLFADYSNMSIASADFEMNIQLNSTEYQKSENSTQLEASAEFKAKWGWGELKISGRVANQRSSVSGSEVKRSYGLNVKVHMEREDPPEVVEKLFGLFLDGLTQPKVE